VKTTQERSVGATVLLIEDEPLTLAAMANALQSAGYRVLMASDGEKGLEMALHDSPALIVLDLIMPGLNGFDLADRLHKESISATVPVLVLTAMDLSVSDRARLDGQVWRVAEKGGLATHEFIGLVESGVEHFKTLRSGRHTQ
jgi:CheY-like chemotaxis protein